MSWRGRLPSCNSGFSETALWIQAKFYGKIQDTYSPCNWSFFFLFQNFQTFMIFFFMGLKFQNVTQIASVLFMSDRLSSPWGHSVHFAKCPSVKIFNRLLLPQLASNFNQILWKVWYSRENTSYYLLAVCQKYGTNTEP